MKLAYLYVAVIFVLIPVSAARPMSSLYAQDLHASMLQIGIITSCYSLAPLLIAVRAGKLVDRFGERIPVFLGSLGILTSVLLPYLFTSIEILYLSQLILGGSQLLVLVAVQNGVANASSREGRDKAVGTFSLFASIGMLLGPLIGGYASEHWGFEKSYLLLSVIPIIPMIIAVTKIPQRKPVEATKSQSENKLMDLFSIPNLGRSIFTSMLTLSALDIFYVYFPLYAKSVGLSLSQIGWILAIQGLANSLVRVFMPRLVDHFGRVQVLWVFMFLGATGYGMIPFFDQFLVLAAIAAVLGMGLGVAQPLTIVLTYNAAPEGRTGEVLGLRLAANRLAQTIIPFLLANISQITGLGAIFTVKSLVLCMGSLMARKIGRVAGDSKQGQTEEKGQIQT